MANEPLPRTDVLSDLPPDPVLRLDFTHGADPASDATFCARAALTALRAYPSLEEAGGIQTAAQDLIADLLHLVHVTGNDAELAIDRGWRDFAAGSSTL